jgi:GT2 family glycosyltransferase
MSLNNTIHLSIVSHGQASLVNALLCDLEKLKCAKSFQVTIIINISENLSSLDFPFSFPISVIKNKQPKGFSANHNFAFRHAPFSDQRKYFIVLNPDLRIINDIFTPLTQILNNETKIGVIAPLVKNPEGFLEDSVRKIPTPRRLFKRLFSNFENYDLDSLSAFSEPDWVAGMFLAFRTETFELVGGFNEKYFLYCEDVDICCRLWLCGFSVRVDLTHSIVHDARRESRHNIKYMRWHLSSLVRFFLSSVYRKTKFFHSKRKVQSEI